MNEGFISRLKVILDHYELSSSSFADKVGVQRSSVSHLLSGRNRPSLDFVMKLVQAFPEVNIYWLLNGKGSFPSPPTKSNPIQNFLDSNTAVATAPAFQQKRAAQIIIFYEDGTFESFHPKK